MRDQATADALLAARDVRVSFGGVHAADGVSADVWAGELLAIIGPNGSGKTTFLNLCTGYLKPESGSISLSGEEIAGLSPRAIAQRGIARAFQIPQLFTEHTIAENLMLSVAARTSPWESFAPLDRKAYRSEADRLLALVGLNDAAHKLPAELPEGMRKLADIAVALALDPRLLLLDEPTSGVSTAEKFPLMDTLIAALRQQNVTTVVVEHDMDLVRRYADRVLVWHEGRVVAQGRPEDVLNDPEVITNVVGME
jgi:branched-chain amino acid transport system ATP-binding protein